MTCPHFYYTRLYQARIVPTAAGPGSTGAVAQAIQRYRSKVGLMGSWSLDIAGDIYSGLVHSPAGTIPEMTPSCPSGTCTWETFESLGLCTKVADITDRIRVNPVPCSTQANWTAWSSTVEENPLRLNGTLAYKTIAFADDADLAAAKVAGYKLAWSIAGNATYRRGSNATRDQPWRWRAAEVIYYACVNQ
ncbi:hypothetical protein OQA88_8433 [Cercophora sp. LCS_1]